MVVGDGHREGVEPLNLYIYIYIWAVLQFICNQMYLTCRNHTIACRIDNRIEGIEGRSTEGLPGVVLAGLSTLFAVVRIDCQFYSHFDKNQLGSYEKLIYSHDSSFCSILMYGTNKTLLCRWIYRIQVYI